jgi:tetratricopeptide (TPR) repeat protein
MRARRRNKQLQREDAGRRRSALRIALGALLIPLLIAGVIGGSYLFGTRSDRPVRIAEEDQSLTQEEISAKVEELLTQAESTGDFRLFEQALVLSPDDPQVHFRYGMALALTDPNAALEQLSHVLRLDPEHLEALEIYGRLMLEGKRYAEAARRYEKALEVLEKRLAEEELPLEGSERRLDILASLSQAYVGWAGQFLEGSEDPELHQKAYALLEKAEAHLKEVLAVQPERRTVLTALGDIAAYHEEFAEAISYYQRVLERFPHNLEALVKLGRVYLESGDLGAAEEAFSEAWERSPKLGLAALGLGDVYRAQGQLEEALATYREGFRQAPDRPFSPKEELALRLLELDPDDTEVRLWLADEYRKIRRFHNAIAHYGELLERAGERAELKLAAYRGLGECWFGLTDYPKAKGFIRKALELVSQVTFEEGEDLRVRTQLYELLLEADRSWLGVHRLLSSDGMEALLELAKLHLKQGDLIAAKAKLLVLQRDYPFYHAEEVALLAQELARREEQLKDQSESAN